MKINSKDFHVPEGNEVDLRKWRTKVEPEYKSKEEYIKAFWKNTWGTATAALRVQSLCRPLDLSSDRCGGKRRRHPARHVRGQPARLSGVQLQTSKRRRTGTRLSLAHHARSAGCGKIDIFNRSYYEGVLIVRSPHRLGAAALVP
jgi:hypothetical protein